MHLFVAIPTHSGSIEVECLLSIFRLQDHVLRRFPGARVSLSTVVGAPIHIARNVLAARFTQDQSATHLLFVDDDMGFEPVLVDRLIAEDQPVVAAICPSRSLDVERLRTILREGVDRETATSVAARFVAAGNLVHCDGKFDPNANGFIEMNSIGTGVMLIQRAVFDRIAAHYPSLTYPADSQRYSAFGLSMPVLEAFNPLMDDGGVLHSEDISFCHRWRSTGGQIWASIDDVVTHVGRLAVRGRFRDQLDHYGGLPPA